MSPLFPKFRQRLGIDITGDQAFPTDGHFTGELSFLEFFNQRIAW
jgi:hypothetical protein